MPIAPSPDARHRFVVLDSLRGLCACLIVLYHWHRTGFIGQSPFIRHAFLFVDFFFVLSGFVIAASYRHRLRADLGRGQFLLLRLGRIYPLHLFMLVCFLEAECLAWARTPMAGHFAGPTGIPALLANLALIQFAAASKLQWNPPSWSIAVEFWTYLLFSFVLPLPRRTALTLCLLIAAAGAIGVALLPPHSMDAERFGRLLRCCYGFACGVVTFLRFERRGRVRRGPAAATLTEGVALAAVILFVVTCGAGLRSIAAPLVFACTIAIFAREQGWPSRLLATKPLLILGTLSYSIYLTHWFLLSWFDAQLDLFGRQSQDALHLACIAAANCRGTAQAVTADLLALGLLGIVVAMSWLSYRFIERPGMRLSRRCVALLQCGPVPLPRQRIGSA